MQSTEDPEARKADLVAKRGYIKASLTKLIKSLQESTSELSRQNLLVKQERLTSLFSKYEELCMEILDEDGDEYEEAYMRALVMLRELTVQPSAAPAGAVATARDTPASTSSKNGKTKLPTITIPTFTGKCHEYKTFIGLFESLIHNDSSLEDIQKLYYLRNYLADEPYALIKNLPLVSESYSESLTILKDRYDNKFRITNEHINNLLELQCITKSTSTNIRNFVCNAKQELAAIKNLNQSVDTWDPVLLCILTKKLDSYTNKEYQLSRQDDKEPTLKQLFDFLDKRALALENAEPAARAPMQQRLEPTHRFEQQRFEQQNKKKTAHPSASNIAASTTSCLFCVAASG
ncbi:uncharacterized protein [Choristoneura fumiferana]|uniref:uncharacterized protein n=1 Tax=Choristoneura fumiferana TaxID=7141 RepID=UPI003D15DEEC